MSIHRDNEHDQLVGTSLPVKVAQNSTATTDNNASHPVSLSPHPQSEKQNIPETTYLSVVRSRSSHRPSVDSVFSDLSELSFHAHELQNRRLLSNHESETLFKPRSRLWSRLQSLYEANYGALLVLISQFFGNLMNLATRLLETPGHHGSAMHPFQILFIRQTITALLCTIYALYTRSIPHFPLGPRGVRLLLVARGLGGFGGVFGIYFSLLYLPLSEATVLTFLAPILTCYACSLLIPGETFTRQQQIAGFVSLAGVVFIARPSSFFASASPQHASAPVTAANSTITAPTNSTISSEAAGMSQSPTSHQHLIAIGIAMIGVIGSTGAMTSIRAIGSRAHPFVSINYFSTWSAIVSLVCLALFPSVKFRLPGNLIEWSLLISLGLCGFVMQFLLTAGLAYGGPSPTSRDEASSKSRDVEAEPLPRQSSNTISKPKASGTRATAMIYTQMLFALTGDKIVFGVTPGTMSWIGSGLILAGAIWVAAARDKTNISDVQNTVQGSSAQPDIVECSDDGQGNTIRQGLENRALVSAKDIRGSSGSTSTPLAASSSTSHILEEQASLLRDAIADDEDDIELANMHIPGPP